MPLERTAIVTGAGKRVGRAITSALLEDGWSVVAHVHRDEDDVPSGSIRAVADLEDAGCAEAIFAAADDLPPVRLLINNAARFAWDGFGELDSGEMAAHMAINVRAPALLIERFARHQDRSADSLVVNLLDSKLAAPNPDYLSYTLSKQALAGLTELAARALAERGIRVNGIAPALMLRSSGQSEENFEAMHARNPLRRGVEPGDVIDAVRYFISALCVTGQVLVIDSGQRFLGFARDVQFLGESMSAPRLDGLVPDALKVRSARILLESLEVRTDIGFHEFEIGAPQRLLVTVEIWLQEAEAPSGDDPDRAWNYDFLRTEVEEIAASRRFNLQETLAHAVFDRLAAFRGVRALRVRTSKPDVYPEAHGVGVEIASFPGLWPDS